MTKKAIKTQCEALIHQFSKMGELVCRLCSQRITVREGTADDDKIKTWRAIDHALQHMETFFYQCRHCSSWQITRLDMLIHARNIHGGSVGDYLYIDHTYKYVDEILKMLDDCFERRKQRDRIGSDVEVREEREPIQRSEKLEQTKETRYWEPDEPKNAGTHNYCLPFEIKAVGHQEMDLMKSQKKTGQHGSNLCPQLRKNFKKYSGKGLYFRLPKKIETIVGSQIVRITSALYKCRYCSMSSSNKILVGRHMRMHFCRVKCT